MSVMLDVRDREILEFLRQHSGGEVSELCELLGVTRTAIRQRLTRMESAGLIAAELRSQTRGRPRNRYRITSEGSEALGDNYREMAVVLWSVISGEPDEEIRERMMTRVRDRLAERLRSQISGSGTLGDRVDQLAEEMRSTGYRVESVVSDGLPILRETCCPFPLLADMDESICQVERQVLEQVLEAPVEFRSRCRDGQGCCEFQVLRSGPEVRAAVAEPLGSEIQAPLEPSEGFRERQSLETGQAV